jgi:hypothetical protein
MRELTILSFRYLIKREQELHEKVNSFYSLLVTYAMANGRGESAAYPGFMPLASPTSPIPTTVLTKVGTWPGGVPGPQENGVYGSFEGYGDQYGAGMYAQY